MSFNLAVLKSSNVTIGGGGVILNDKTPRLDHAKQHANKHRDKTVISISWSSAVM